MCLDDLYIFLVLQGRRVLDGLSQLFDQLLPLVLGDRVVTLHVLKLVSAPVEAVTDGLEVEVALTLSLDATGLSDYLVNLYQEAFVAITRYMLRRQPGVPWSDLQAAAIDLAEYEDHRADAAADKFLGYSGGDATMTNEALVL